jgi:DNA-binding MarR family transcriptional regulator
MSESAITIDLTKAQINGVIGEAGKDAGLQSRAGVIARIEFRASPEQLDDRRLSRSLLRGLMVLACFPADGTARTAKDVAKELDMGGSTTHRYITTLAEAGLLVQDPVSRQYRRVV